jgi:DNA replication protein DnaD
MSQGWIKLHRELFEKAIWQNSTPEQKVILITLLGMANHRGKEWEWKGRQFKAAPGQFVTSLDSICEKCGKGISVQNVRSALVKFKNYDFLTDESTKTGRLITIVNWSLYQGIDEDTNKDINNELTKSQQSGNKEVTPNKNDKNAKNDKKDIIYTSESNEYRLAAYLFNYIKKNNDKAKEPNFQTWAKEFEKVLRIDNRELEEVKKLIAWCQSDSFWHLNILSPKKFREKYDQLLITMKNDKQGNKRGAKVSNFNNFEQRTYDFDELEVKLLENSAVEEPTEDPKQMLKKLREGG